MTRLPELEHAAHAASWGVPHQRLLTLSDPVELLVEHHLVNRAVDLRIEHEEAISDRTGHAAGQAVGKALGG